MNGTLINYYVHCKRQCYLSYNRLNLEDNSELVSIGKELHKNKLEDSTNSEIKLENIALDKITKDYIIEVKKSNADKEASKWQLYYYLYILKSKGIIRKGRLEFIETRGDKKTEILELTEAIENELEKMIVAIENMAFENIPEAIKIKGCNKCAYYEYCFI